MSLIRPELRATLLQWREFIILFLVVLICALAVVQAHGLFKWLAVLGGLLSTGFLYPAYLSARGRVTDSGPGMVEITERRIRYLGPFGGSDMSINDLARVAINSMGRAGARWEFHDRFGNFMSIPTGAEGADALLPALSALPGLDNEAAMSALAKRRAGMYQIWDAT